MKSFLIKCSIFLTIGFCLLFLICEGIMRYPLSVNANYFNRWFTTYQVIAKSNENIESDTLYIGDSVAGQFFRPEEQKNHLAYTASILMPGQYILAANTIKSNPNLKSIILINGPLTIGQSFGQYTTYPYFIKPFYLKRNFPHITQQLQNKINQYPYASFFQYSIVKLAPFSDVDCTENQPTDNQYMLSSLAIEYLKKLDKLCQENNIMLRVVSSPTMDSYIEQTNNWAGLKQQIQSEKLDEIFEGYFESIQYLAEDQFIDGFHIKANRQLDCKQHITKFLKNFYAIKS